MRISDWSSDVCSADLPRPCADKTPAPKSRLSFMSTEFSAPTTGDVIRASGIGFGTIGARGLVDDLSDEACAAFVMAFVSVAGQRFDFGRIAVGWDLRPSSPRIAAAVMAAVRVAGMESECCVQVHSPATI